MASMLQMLLNKSLLNPKIAAGGLLSSLIEASIDEW